MKKTQIALIVLLLGVVLVSLGVRSWRAPAVKTADPVVPALPAAAEVVQRPSMPQEENRPAIAPDPLQRITVSSDTAAGEQPIEHMLRGIVSVNADELGLTPQEVDRLVAETLEFHEIHTEIIARYLREMSFDPNVVLLRVPPFPVEGKALRDLYHQRLTAALSEEKMKRIQEQIGGYLDQSFRGFGIAEQIYTLTRSPENPSAFELGWEIKVPDGQTPSGLDPGLSYPGSAGRAYLTREQITSGEYRFLAPAIEKHFR